MHFLHHCNFDAEPEDKVLNRVASIYDYMWNKIMFTEIDKDFWGVANKEGFGIFINRQIGKNSKGLGIGGYIITITHEFVGHLLRVLININDRILASTSTPQKVFITIKDNDLSKSYMDGGDKFEAIVFGKKVQRLYIGGNHFLLDTNNWNLPLETFRNKFLRNNIKKSPKVLKKELEKIKNSNNVMKEFFKNINYGDVNDDIQTQSIKTRFHYENDSSCLNMDGFR